MSDIVVDIAHLVLDGVPGELANSPYIGQMIEREVQRLFEQHGLPPGLAGGDVRQSMAPPVSVPTPASAGQIAYAAATALYQALSTQKGSA
jgi:hypothetical protein